MRFPRFKLIGVGTLAGLLVAAGALVRTGGARPATQAPTPPIEAKPAPAASDLDRLQGRWVKIAMETGGISRLLPQDQQVELRIEGTAFYFGTGGKSPEVARLDPTGTPKQIDLAATGDNPSPAPSQPYVGIYVLEGDTLMTCYDFSGKRERPRQFATKFGDGVIIDIYRRADQ